MNEPLTAEQRIELASIEIADVLERFDVEFAGEYDGEMWLEVAEDEKPTLTVV